MKAHIKKSLRADKLREFIQRRRINTIGVFILTLLSLVLTIFGALVSFPRTYVLAFVTVMLTLLSALAGISSTLSTPAILRMMQS